MNTRTLLNLGLLASCVALSWFAFEIDTPKPAAPGIAITSLSVDQINTIEIERDGSMVTRLQRSAGAWRIKRPINALADPFRVQTLLGIVHAHSDTGFRATGNDLTQYGLQSPRASVQFDATTLHIGETDPIAGHRYVMVGDQVHLLEDTWFAQIFGSATAWLNPRLLPEGAVLLRIELRSSTGHHAHDLVHRDAPSAAVQQWRLVDAKWQHTLTGSAPSTQPSAQRGAALAHAWLQARALSVRPHDRALDWHGQALVAFKPPRPSAAKQQRAVTHVDEQETITFLIARTDDGLFLAREDLGVQYRFLRRQGNALLGVTVSN